LEIGSGCSQWSWQALWLCHYAFSLRFSPSQRTNSTYIFVRRQCHFGRRCLRQRAQLAILLFGRMLEKRCATLAWRLGSNFGFPRRQGLNSSLRQNVVLAGTWGCAQGRGRHRMLLQRGGYSCATAREALSITTGKHLGKAILRPSQKGPR